MPYYGPAGLPAVFPFKFTNSAGVANFEMSQDSTTSVLSTSASNLSRHFTQFNSGNGFTELESTNTFSALLMNAEVGQTAALVDIADENGTSRFQITPTGGFVSKPIVSGALPTASPSSGTALQISTAREVNLIVPVTFNPTGAATATCKVELSPDNVTFSTTVTKTFPISVALAGSIDEVTVRVPAAWYVKLTVTNATLGTGTYW